MVKKKIIQYSRNENCEFATLHCFCASSHLNFVSKISDTSFVMQKKINIMCILHSVIENGLFI